MRKSHKWAPEAPGPIIVSRPLAAEPKGFVAGLINRMRRTRRTFSDGHVPAKGLSAPSTEAINRS
ncbi:hypothetical protein HDIA_0917 [Hartmannibacter diazotrophicus]|uniref:Uncharacterized protein n=1 Tax=Hartmannibacter diazotrophicus TaxID=1482074 RepID=A0A2C9D2T0_9HYPH|nr:hypothetical protein [Hartmannibacter diazotrophicus]SON54458.1 hypothetical protein HDIA_0917 [Hartmannibacter diazotrophicus]